MENSSKPTLNPDSLAGGWRADAERKAQKQQEKTAENQRRGEAIKMARLQRERQGQSAPTESTVPDQTISVEPTQPPAEKPANDKELSILISEAQRIVEEKVMRFKVLLDQVQSKSGNIGNIFNRREETEFSEAITRFSALSRDSTTIPDLLKQLKNFQTAVDNFSGIVAKNKRAAENYFGGRAPAWVDELHSAFRIRKNELTVAVSDLATLQNRVEQKSSK